MDDQEPDKRRKRSPAWLTEPIQAEAEAEPADVPAVVGRVSQGRGRGDRVGQRPTCRSSGSAARERPVEPSPE